MKERANIKKQKNFLFRINKSNKLGAPERQIANFTHYAGPGIKKKIQRLLFSPAVYVPYIFRELGLRPFKNRMPRLFWGRRIRISPTVERRRLNLDLSHSFGVLLYEPEVRLTKFFIKNFKASDIFYDVGANYGFYTYLAIEFCEEVHSFEPLPEIFADLKINLINDSNVFLNNIALSNKTEVIEFFVSGVRSTLRKEALEFLDAPKNKIVSNTITLDQYLLSHQPPAIIKIDVEGAESLVIDGGLDFFKKATAVVSMEVWPQNKGGELSMQAVVKLRELGYKSYLITADGSLEVASGDLSQMVYNSGLDFDNFIFKKG